MKKIIDLNRNWHIRQWEPGLVLAGDLDKKAEWLSADLPQQVHDILVRAGKIDDPCLPGGRTRECLWVAEQDWLYKKQFSISNPNGAAKLIFCGLDTIADIYLNGVLMAKNDDMFVPLSIDVQGRLGRENTLLVYFHSPHFFINSQKIPSAWQDKIAPHKLIRKHHHDFIDYLGAHPYFTNMGIYDQVYLETIEGMAIEDIDVRQSLSADYATAWVRSFVSGQGSGTLRLTLSDPGGTQVAATQVQVSAGFWVHELSLEVQSPLLWWPRGYGNQPLYSLCVTTLEEGAVADELRRDLGFRRIQIASDLKCIVNDRPVKLWGGNLAPIKGRTHCWDGQRVRAILDRIELCNMNCVRIWGGGELYKDELYQEADRRGLLLWHDFFNEYGMYPDTREYRRLCRREAEFQVHRLKHHASILLWCGGNENHMGRDYSFPGEKLIGQEIYEEDYPGVCKKLDPDRYYHVSSPSGGRFANDPSEGDTHNYTTTWHVPGIEFPVFTTENMRVSMPPLRGMRRYFREEDIWPEGYTGAITHDNPLPWPETWMERTSGGSPRKIPPIERYFDATDAESFVHNYAAAHGEYLRKSVEAHRRGRPSDNPNGERISQGHLVWKINATWPHFYSNILDYYLEPYIPFYDLKRAYEPILLSFDIGDHIHLWLVNDTTEPVRGTIRALAYDTATDTIYNELAVRAECRAGHSQPVTHLDEFGQFPKDHILFASFTVDGRDIVARAVDYVAIERYHHFPPAFLVMSFDGEALILSTDRFARCVELSGDEEGDEFGWIFEDNYFDLMPWEEKRVMIHGDHREGRITARPHYSPHTATLVLPPL